MAGMMTSLPAMVSAGSSILQLGGGLMAGFGAKSAGESERRALQFQAAQLEQNAGQAIAASQRRSAEERRRAALVASRALAVAAAGGGSASDTTVQNIIANLDGEGAYRSMVALYEGEEKSRQLMLAAAGKRYEGDLAAKGGTQKGIAYGLAGFGSAASSAASFFAKYGRGGPSSIGATGDSALLDSSNSGGWDT